MQGVPCQNNEKMFVVLANIMEIAKNLMENMAVFDRPVNGSKRYAKGYNLTKRVNNKLGFVYYVRYYHDGKMLGSKWCTHTNIESEAEYFAVSNREKIIKAYINSKHENTFDILRDFYIEGSKYLRREKAVTDGHRKWKLCVMTNKLIPFLKLRGINVLEKITTEVMEDFQDYLVCERGVKPQTVNKDMTAIAHVFRYLKRKNIIESNPCEMVEALPVDDDDKVERGCYEVDKLQGVFGKLWDDETERLLCEITYTTGMRNGEINRIRLNDIETEGDVHFINIQTSKTQNGLRFAPLHDTVYDDIIKYAAGKNSDEAIFRGNTYFTTGNANLALGKHLGYDEAALKKENITFYSGRHFWKTMMNDGGLGDDVEEVFMGHKVSNDVAKSYNHRDKQGKERLVKKAKEVFAILDKRIF